ncbi:MAG TPA: VOC family protein [Candidatus Eisenbacteria bacterium]
MTITRIIPMLPVASIARSIEFYRKLGFETEKRNDEWGWAMLALGDCRLMLDQSIQRHPSGPRESILYLYPDDIEAYHREVRRNGLDIPDLDITFYGLTEFRLDDPDGNRLWIGQDRRKGS